MTKLGDFVGEYISTTPAAQDHFMAPGQRLSRECERDSTGADRSKFHAPLLSLDRKSTRLNSSHGSISYAVFCLKKKNEPRYRAPRQQLGIKQTARQRDAGEESELTGTTI